MKIAIVLFSMFTSASAFAGFQGYEGKGGEKLFIDCPSANECYVKFTDVQSVWAGKVIKTKKLSRPYGNAYQFSDKSKNPRQIVVDHGFELVNGSRVPQVQLFFPEGDRNSPLELDLSKSLSGQKMDLAGQYSKTPFVPED